MSELVWLISWEKSLNYWDDDGHKRSDFEESGFDVGAEGEEYDEVLSRIIKRTVDEDWVKRKNDGSYYFSMDLKFAVMVDHSTLNDWLPCIEDHPTFKEAFELGQKVIDDKKCAQRKIESQRIKDLERAEFERLKSKYEPDSVS